MEIFEKKKDFTLFKRKKNDWDQKTLIRKSEKKSETKYDLCI